jgi:putative transposase
MYGRHLYQLTFPIVFSTKDRAPLIREEFREDLYKYMGGIVRGEGGTTIEIGGMPDHIHWLVIMKTEPSEAQFVKVVKAKSSKWVNDGRLLRARFSWQVGYGAFTVSHSQLGKVRKYIQNQAEHHRQVTFQEEFLEFLHRHKIEYDPQRIWE